jgi:ABC-type lipoprotein release transport system permease subunit
MAVRDLLRTLDPATFAAVTSLLIVVAFVAYRVPARWAARVDPVEALRQK